MTQPTCPYCKAPFVGAREWVTVNPLDGDDKKTWYRQRCVNCRRNVKVTEDDNFDPPVIKLQVYY